MANQVMLHTSGHLSQKIESLDMYRDKFIDLLEMYVNESRLQVCALIESLRKASKKKIQRIGYDDACHLW